jgi:glucuronate isomerase
MSSVRKHIELQGPWEKIVSESDQLAGRVVRVATTDDEVDQITLHERLDRILEEASKIVPVRRDRQRTSFKSGASDLIAEKFRKQGLDV